MEETREARLERRLVRGMSQSLSPTVRQQHYIIINPATAPALITPRLCASPPLLLDNVSHATESSAGGARATQQDARGGFRGGRGTNAIPMATSVALRVSS